MARRPRPTGVPPDAWWSNKDREWVLGDKDARGRLHGLVRYYRDDGTLVSEARFRNGVVHGRARRVYENGATFQTCTYDAGALHGRRMFYPPTGPTVEPPILRWHELGAGVVAYRVDYDHGDVVATRYVDARGREVTTAGQPIPRRPRRVPATASPMGEGWLEMRRGGKNGEHTLISREYRADGSLHREHVRAIDREFHDNGVLAEQGQHIANRMPDRGGTTIATACCAESRRSRAASRRIERGCSRPASIPIARAGVRGGGVARARDDAGARNIGSSARLARA